MLQILYKLSVGGLSEYSVSMFGFHQQLLNTTPLQLKVNMMKQRIARAGFVNMQLFANTVAITTLEGDNMQVLYFLE